MSLTILTKKLSNFLFQIISRVILYRLLFNYHSFKTNGQKYPTCIKYQTSSKDNTWPLRFSDLQIYLVLKFLMRFSIDSYHDVIISNGKKITILLCFYCEIIIYNQFRTKISLTKVIAIENQYFKSFHLGDIESRLYSIGFPSTASPKYPLRITT